MGEWDEVRGELGRVREECEGLVRQLAEAERKLQLALQQRDQLEEQVRVCLTALLNARLIHVLVGSSCKKSCNNMPIYG